MVMTGSGGEEMKTEPTEEVDLFGRQDATLLTVSRAALVGSGQTTEAMPPGQPGDPPQVLL